MKIVKDRQFRRRVDVEFPAEDGVEVQSFTALFLALQAERMEGRFLRTDEEQSGFLSEVLIGWEGLSEDRGDEVAPYPFSPGNLRELLQDVFVRRALLKTYLDAMAGVKRGN